MARTISVAETVLMLFCKAPELNTVKTRLQTQLSAQQALAAHLELTQLSLVRACQIPNCAIQLHCTPSPEHAFFRDCAQRYPITLVAQQGEDIGARMANALATALTTYRYAMVMGCDCPSLTHQQINQAFEILKAGYDVVIAPAEDGGYVLLGLSAPQPCLFNAMRWSQVDVMAETRLRIQQARLRAVELPVQWDVDRPEDWQRYLITLRC